MKTLIAFTILALSTSALAQAPQATSPAQAAANEVISQLTEIQTNRQNYEIQTEQYRPVGDYLLQDCITLAQGLRLFLGDATAKSATEFVRQSPYDQTSLTVIPAHNETFDNLKIRFRGIEGGFDFNRTAPGDSDSGEMTLGQVSLRVWQAPNMKTKVFLRCVKDFVPHNGYND